MKIFLMILFSFLLLIIPISNSEILAANPVPADCVSLTGYYPSAPEGVTYYTFGNPLETYNGYKSYFRVFIPPGAVVEDMLILEYGKQMAVARHNVIMPATVLPEFPPSGYIANNRYLLSELEADNQWVTENLEGYLYISHDSFYPYLDNTRAGWLYVKVGGGQYSDYYSNQFTVKVDAKVYNEWWNKYIKNEDGWNKYVQNVGVYIDPTATQPILTVDPPNQAVTNTSGELTIKVLNTGTGTMSWTASINADGSWLRITSDSSGVNDGPIVCTYDANTAIAERLAKITVTATGATNSPATVTVTQAGAGGRVVSIIPDTGLTKCYDSQGEEIDCLTKGQGQDGSLTINPMSYAKLDANGAVVIDPTKPWAMIKDNVTGLIWEAKTKKDSIQNYSDIHDADNVYPWLDLDSAANTATAIADVNLIRKDMKYFIDEMNKIKFGGFDDWRLPTISELITLTSYNNVPDEWSKLTAAIDSTYFLNTQLGPYWSSSSYNYMKETADAWVLDFRYGNADYLGKNEKHYVRAVRGPRASLNSADRFVDNNDGTVTDKTNGLMWQKETNKTKMNWEDALYYCTLLNVEKFADHDDWRLPSVKELQSLVNYYRTSPPAISDKFTLNETYYWTATTVTAYKNYLSYAWFVDFLDGAPFPYDKMLKENYVRAVRQVPVISIYPVNKTLEYGAETVIFDVYIGGGSLTKWDDIIVIEKPDWIKSVIVTGAGVNDKKKGNITCEYDANPKAESRTATISIKWDDADNSPVSVVVTQKPMCTAIQSDSLLQLPYIVYESPTSGKTFYWADFNILSYGRYSLGKAGVLTSPSESCTQPSTLATDLSIDIPNVVINELNCKMMLVYQQDGVFLMKDNPVCQ